MGPRRPPNEILNDCKHISAFHVVELQDSKSPARFGSVDADVAVLTAFATPFMAMLAMLWHQQRAILKQLGENGERLARIEGYLGIGMPAAAASEAPGAALAATPAGAEGHPMVPGTQRAKPAATD